MEDFDATLAKEPYRMLPLIVYAALKAGDDVNDLPDGFTERQAGRWLMGIEEGQSAVITDMFRHSMGFIINSYQAQPVAEKGKKPALKASQ